MSNLKRVATLTGTLLCSKGGAAPSAFLSRPSFVFPEPNGAEQGAMVQPLSSRGRGKDDRRTKLSVRMSSARHHRLRVAAAHLDQSAQTLILEALDYYVDHVLPTLIEGSCTCLELGVGRGDACPADRAIFGGGAAS